MFNFEAWKDRNVVMHCKTFEETKYFCNMMNKENMKLCSGHSYDPEYLWSFYNKELCFDFNKGKYSGIAYFIRHGYEILECSNYMDTDNDMKDFVVHCETEEVPTRRKCLEQAIKIICSDRNDSYGNPEDNFHTMAEFTTDYLHARDLLPKDKYLTDEDAAVISILFKIARRASGRYKEDTYIDIAGYAACAMEVGEKYNG